MIKVIGEDTSIAKRITCRHCSSILEYLPIDVKSYHGTDYSGGPDGKEFIICPKCDEEVIIKAW